VVATIDALDHTLNDVCLANEDGAVPDGSVTTFSLEAFSVSCSRVDREQQLQWAEAVTAESDSAVVVFGLSSVDSDTATTATITISTWNTGSVTQFTSANGTLSEAELLSSIVGLHVSGATTTSSGVGGGGGQPASGMVSVDDTTDYSISIAVEATSAPDADLRKAVSCRYYDPDRSSWSERGVFLQGLKLLGLGPDGAITGGEETELALVALQVSAICVTTHLTLFSLGDGSAAVQVLEDKLQALGDRVEAIGSAALLDGNTEVNWPILAAFAGATLLFLWVVSVSKAAGRKGAVEEARAVYLQLGVLARPQVRSARLH
jgi:hypothetical protein